MSTAISAMVLVLAAVNLALTVCVIRDSSLLPAQKLAQCLLVWLLPALGAIVVAIVLYSHRDSTRRGGQHIRSDQDYPGVNLYPPHGPGDP